MPGIDELFEDYKKAAVQGMRSTTKSPEASYAVAEYQLYNLTGLWVEEVVQGLYPGFSEPDSEGLKPEAAQRVGEFLHRARAAGVKPNIALKLNQALIKKIRANYEADYETVERALEPVAIDHNADKATLESILNTEQIKTFVVSFPTIEGPLRLISDDNVRSFRLAVRTGLRLRGKGLRTDALIGLQEVLKQLYADWETAPQFNSIVQEVGERVRAAVREAGATITPPFSKIEFIATTTLPALKYEADALALDLLAARESSVPLAKALPVIERQTGAAKLYQPELEDYRNRIKRYATSPVSPEMITPARLKFIRQEAPKIVSELRPISEERRRLTGEQEEDLMWKEHDALHQAAQQQREREEDLVWEQHGAPRRPSNAGNQRSQRPAREHDGGSPYAQLLPAAMQAFRDFSNAKRERGRRNPAPAKAQSPVVVPPSKELLHILEPFYYLLPDRVNSARTHTSAASLLEAIVAGIGNLPQEKMQIQLTRNLVNYIWLNENRLREGESEQVKKKTREIEAGLEEKLAKSYVTFNSIILRAANVLGDRLVSVREKELMLESFRKKMTKEETARTLKYVRPRVGEIEYAPKELEPQLLQKARIAACEFLTDQISSLYERGRYSDVMDHLSRKHDLTPNLQLMLVSSTYRETLLQINTASIHAVLSNFQKAARGYAEFLNAHEQDENPAALGEQFKERLNADIIAGRELLRQLHKLHESKDYISRFKGEQNQLEQAARPYLGGRGTGDRGIAERLRDLLPHR